ncbi:hypothetical protein IID22_02845, partial [Patescibacteria group bacterium]|nr:hypothetical protein [Patescibacteria group bacterium]
MKLFKLLLFLFLAFLIFATSAQVTRASLVTIDKEGKVVINVLSAEESIELEIPRRDYLEVKNIAEVTPDPDAKISLLRVNGKVKLNISTSSGDKSLDVTNYKGEIVEIEERPAVERIAISVLGDKFEIVQRGVVAITTYEINIDPQTARITLETPSGLRFLSILPRQAVDITLQAKYINRIGGQDKLDLKEEGGDLSYVVHGDKVINPFDLFEYNVPVKVYVSASTGEILSVDQPTWLRILGFLFV